ncbi:right-handed parallel beta-helix repeat-containing protein [Candidatus Micrarchaeota archaeon]|nr:right-handed parallel beta-helix repeat-containing protein [Candidatus Micrarchaeota archaeon]
MAKPARSSSRGNARFNQSAVSGAQNPCPCRGMPSQSAVRAQARPGAESSQEAWKRHVADCLKASGMTRADFLKMAGVTAGAVAATGMGLGGTARAQVPPAMGPVTPNPDPTHIHVISPDYIEVYPVGTDTRQTLLEAGRVQDPRISTFDEASYNPETGTVLPLSETNPGTPENPTEWDSRHRTLDAMNVEWAVNNVQKNGTEPGTVLLKNTGTPFEFGSGWYWAFDMAPGFGVFLCNDCNITGEVDAGGNPLTRINHGAACFVANWWHAFYAFGSGVQLWHDFVSRFTFKNLILEDSTYPSLLSYSGFDISSWTPHVLEYVEVENVRVIGAMPSFAGGDVNMTMLFENDYGKVVVRNCYINALNSLDPSDPYNTGWNFMAGIAVTSSMTGPPYQAPAGPYLIAENNTLDIASSHLGSMGILAGGASGAEIRNNQVTADIAFISGDVGWTGDGVVTIENNTCTARVGGFSCVNGIGNEIELFTGPYQHPGAAITISGNSVNMDNSGSIDLIHGMMAGIFAQDIFFDGIPSNCLKNATVQNNTFTGNADFGVFMGNFWDVPDTASGNNFLYNDFKSLSSGVATVYLGAQTSNNVFGPNKYPPGGAFHEVLNEGTNNRITGMPANTVTSPGIGQVVRDKISQSKTLQGTYAARIPKKDPRGFGLSWPRK